MTRSEVQVLHRPPCSSPITPYANCSGHCRHYPGSFTDQVRLPGETVHRCDGMGRADFRPGRNLHRHQTDRRAGHDRIVSLDDRYAQRRLSFAPQSLYRRTKSKLKEPRESAYDGFEKRRQRRKPEKFTTAKRFWNI